MVSKISCNNFIESLYRKDDSLPFKCFGDAPSESYEKVSLATCSLACNKLKDCLAFQFYETRKCDLFVKWSIWIKQSVEGCSLFIRAELCPLSFAYIPSSKTCYKLEVGSWNWEQARSWCNRLSPPNTFPAVINTLKKINAVDFFLNSVIDSYNIQCYNDDYYARKIWFGGQRENPFDVQTSFYWKPFVNVSLSLGNETNWQSFQPDGSSMYPKLESCIAFATNTYQWNDLECFHLKCALCEATSGVN
ncbi:hypothetical protein HELRODRAFT_183750 [Helobdella robusta]|uniref:C-type lectin domain-containing protein n=1 Tax=Helobdella robusta TaxID=6412 RepID=T1FK51_HELRO|nr:hypothetical protein HELRODRAFT_183750 [Helobdella robusta]ESO10334.1 hypothetical protein HELRODRAFT_183750 [Helobdella robusta]